MKIRYVQYGSNDEFGNAFQTFVMSGGWHAPKILEAALKSAGADQIIYRSYPHIGRGSTYRCRFTAYRGGACITRDVLKRLGS